MWGIAAGFWGAFELRWNQLPGLSDIGQKATFDSCRHEEHGSLHTERPQQLLHTRVSDLGLQRIVEHKTLHSARQMTDESTTSHREDCLPHFYAPSVPDCVLLKKSKAPHSYVELRRGHS
jgi:hypothetical protein